VVCACEGLPLEGAVCACDGGLPEGEVCACDGLLPEGGVCARAGLFDEAGADWLVVEFDGWLGVEESADGAFLSLEGADDELEAGGLDCVEGGGFLVASPGDWAKAAVPKTRPMAVLTNSCLFIRSSCRSVVAVSNNRKPGPAVPWSGTDTANYRRNHWPVPRLTVIKTLQEKYQMKKVMIALALGASAMLASAASAAPLSKGVSVMPDNGIENVRMVCNEYGRCWREPSRRVIVEDSYGYAPRERYIERRGYYDGGYYEGPRVGIGVGPGGVGVGVGVGPGW
jgi:hypothetical protein